MQQHKTLYAPRHWPSWFGMAAGWLLGILPYPLQMWLGRRIGELAWLILPGRRHVADVNLRLCFPALTPAARGRLLREHFRSVGMGAMETLICWWASAAKIGRLVTIEGLHELEKAAAEGRGLLLLSAHFTSLELGVRMAKKPMRQLGYITTAVYKPPHNPVVAHVMRRRRESHIGGPSITHDDVRGLIRTLERGGAVWYAADQKAINKFSAEVPFFGVPARTSLATGRIAAMSGAAVVPFFTLRREDGRGYRIIVRPPLRDFPSGDEIADARRLNTLIEEMVREAPAQYFWLHRRFRSDDRDPYGNTPTAAR